MVPSHTMGSPRKTLDAVLSGRRDKNIRFDDLCRLLARLSFDERVKGDHHIYTREDVQEIINIQPRRDGHAKPYQVRQVRDIITRYQLGIDE